MNGGPLGYNGDMQEMRIMQRPAKVHKGLRCALCSQLQPQLPRNGILGWGRKNEPLHHTMAQMDGSGRVSNLRDAPVSPLMAATLPAALGRGEITRTDCTAKTASWQGSQQSLFFWFPPRGDKAGSQQTVSLTCTCLTAKEGRGSRAKGEPDHPLSAGKCCRGRLPSCEQGRLGNARGPGDNFIRKEEENPGKQSQKEGGKVCKNESGRIAGSFTQSYPQ